MTPTLLLRLAERALNEIPRYRGIPGLDGDDVPHPFNGVFDSYALAAAIGRYLRENNGFTVILGYPDSSETYSSTSDAKTWQEAVAEVAEEMLNEKVVSVADELTITDVYEGKAHATYPGADRNAVVRFNSETGKASVLNSAEVAAYDSMDRENCEAMDRLVRGSKKELETRRIVMGESTSNPDRFKKGERVEP